MKTLIPQREHFNAAELLSPAWTTHQGGEVRGLHRLVASVRIRAAPGDRWRLAAAYLEEAAELGRRKVDWLNIFVGQVVSMVMGGLIASQQWGDVMRHARVVLGAIFDIGRHLLGP